MTRYTISPVYETAGSKYPCPLFVSHIVSPHTVTLEFVPSDHLSSGRCRFILPICAIEHSSTRVYNSPEIISIVTLFPRQWDSRTTSQSNVATNGERARFVTVRDGQVASFNQNWTMLYVRVYVYIFSSSSFRPPPLFFFSFATPISPGLLVGECARPFARFRPRVK